jgi:transmembrane sensor
MSNINIDDLLDKYQKGQLTSEEILLVEKWLRNQDSQLSTWAKLDAQGKDKWLGSVLNRVNDTIDQREAPVVRLQRVHKSVFLRWSAAAAILIGFCIFFYITSINHATIIPLATLKTPASMQKAITLADGSRVSINAGSELRYPQSFKGKTREVFLSGEGYFDIHHDAAKPFIIHTGNIVTTVLGTAFNIKEDKINHTVVVTVTNGKVSVANGGHLLDRITPGQQLSFNTSNGQTTKLQVNAIKVIAWQKIGLQFEDVTFEAAVKQLELRFNTKINFANNRLKHCRFTGASLAGDNLTTVLTAICGFNNATYQTLTDGSILINGQGCD